jgi:hypothetical protein
VCVCVCVCVFDCRRGMCTHAYHRPIPTHITHTPHHTTQVIQAAKISGARRIIAIDTNPAKFSSARAMGATDCVDPTALDVPIQQHIVAMTQVSFSFLRARHGSHGLRGPHGCRMRGPHSYRNAIKCANFVDDLGPFFALIGLFLVLFSAFIGLFLSLF